MRLDAIRSFITVVETGSYASAAEVLYTSATTLHSHVKAIQDELTVPLITFSGRRLELTAAGHQFLIFAQRLVLDYEELTSDLSSRVRPARTTIKIMSPHGPAVHLLPPVVRAFQEEHGDTIVQIDNGLKGESLAALASKQTDIAVMNDIGVAHHRDVFEASPVYEDRLVAVIRADHEDGEGEELLARYPIAAQPSGSPSRQYLERWSRSRGLDLDVRYEHATFDGIASYVLAGECVGITSEYIMQQSHGQLRVIELPAFDLPRRIVALHHPRPSPQVAAFVEALSAYYAKPV